MIQQLGFGTRLFQLLWTARPVVTAWLTAATLIALVFLMVPNSLAAQTLGHEALRRELATAVGQIKQKLDNQPAGSRSVSIQPFLNARNSYASETAGHLIARLIEQHLREQGVQVLAKAANGLRGSFQILSETIQAKVLMELEDSKGNVLYKREISFLEPEVVALLTPDPVKPDKNPLSRVYQEQNKFRTTRESPFQVEILVADEATLPRDRKPIAEDYTAPECSLKDGYAFANLEEGQCYALRIHNQSDRDACFNLSVDGLNVFQLSKDQKPRYFILRKKTSVLMTGWIIDGQTHAFLVTDEDKGAWKKSNVSRSQLRYINIRFHSFEESPSPAVATARSIATAPGPKLTGSYRHIKGKVGDLIESLNILYDRPGK